jgi:hypothetical protein
MKIIFLLLSGLIFTNLSGQLNETPGKTKVMTLGVFHFAYPNLDVNKTGKKDQISVLEEPYQSEIIAISKAIEEYKPTIIAVEQTPDKQQKVDSALMSYLSGRMALGKSEIDQIAMRLAKDLNLTRLNCVDDFGKHYDNILAIFNDSIRLSKFEDYFYKSRDTTRRKSGRITSIVEELCEMNNPDLIKKDLSVYLSNPFKYEEQPGDFTGVDFETGRWFNRNLRIFRNIQRIPHDSGDRILVIFGAGHMNLLNMLFDVSDEFEFVSPLPYLEAAKRKHH